MTTKEMLHHLIDTLPESLLPEVERFLEALRAQEDPVLRAFLDAPEDDEEETEKERLATREAYDALDRGDIFTLDEVRRELGL